MCETSIAVIGHVDHGKSTLIGRMLYESGYVSDEKLSSIKEGDQINFANLLDAFVEEQSEGKTINSMRVSLRLNNRDFIFFDVPGHAEFVDQMAMSTSRVQWALVVIDVNEGVQEQTIHHLNIAHLFGVDNVIVIINKMDIVDFSEKRYYLLKKEVEKVCDEIGISVHAHIPVSGQDGINIFCKSKEISWYGGEALIDVLHITDVVKANGEDKLIFSIQDVFDASDQRYAIGKSIASAQKLELPAVLYDLKNARKYSVLSILDTNQEQMQKIDVDDSVSLVLGDGEEVHRGIVLAENRNDVLCTNCLEVRLLWLSEIDFSDEQNFSLKLSVQSVLCRVFPKKKEWGHAGESVIKGDIILCDVICDNNLVFTHFWQFSTLGIAVISADNSIVAIAVL